MRTASAGLIALLNDSTQFVVADLLTIVQANGTITRLTNASVDVTAVSRYDDASHTFSSALPFTRGETRLVIGSEVDTLSLTLMPGAANTLGGVAWPAAVRAGALDEAEVLLEKAIMPSWGDTSPGTLILFWGRASGPTASRSTVVLPVKSDMVLLQANAPSNVYQPGCLHALFDGGCLLDVGDFTETGTAQSGSTATAIDTGLTFAAGYYDLGTITFTAGPNAGLSRVIRSASGDVVTVVNPFPAAPAVGNAFSIIPGCDKRQSTCTDTFDNLIHFRGYPFVPAAETMR